MKNLFFFFLTILSVSVFAQSKAVNVAASGIEWKGYKVTGSHAGTMKIKSGSLAFTTDKLTGGSFEIDMASLAVTDIQGKMAENLAGHLKADDFFGTAKFPTAKLMIKKVASRGKVGEYKVTADLTIKGITKEIRFDANAAAGMATAAIKIDRTDFDVKYNSGSFFDNLGDKTIYDEFDVNVKLAY
jgi:polyisoprenoid-binding protein YceI